MKYTFNLQGQIIFNTSDIYSLVDPTNQFNISTLPVGKISEKTINRYCGRLNLDKNNLTVEGLQKLGEISATMKAICDYILQYVTDNELNKTVVVNKEFFKRLINQVHSFNLFLNHDLFNNLCVLETVTHRLNSKYANYRDMIANPLTVDDYFLVAELSSAFKNNKDII